MFLDEVTLDVTAGDGGRGAVSFRREKYVAAGGPDGGDGGHGGDVVVAAEAGESTLDRYRFRRRCAAAGGAAGARQRKTGRDGADVILPVPPGTVVSDASSGVILGDLAAPGDSVIVARGGRGGRGNARFATSTRQAPRTRELGEPGGRRSVHLELKLIADIGLVGLPNAGKSTLLAALTGATPKVGDYPFTTLQPNLGVAETAAGSRVILADVPGLIEGAHNGAGLGVEFLRHLERTRVLIHVVDASAGADAAIRALEQVRAELRAFSGQLGDKAALVAFNKIDRAEGGSVAAIARPPEGAYLIAAISGEGCAALLEAAAAAVMAVGGPSSIPPATAAPNHRVYRQVPGRELPAVVSREAEGYRVTGAAIERTVAMTDLENDEAVARLHRRLARAGIDAALAAAGCSEGDTVRIGDAEFTYSDGG